MTQPGPAPRFSATPTALPRAPVPPGTDTDTVLAEAGFAADEIADLRAGGTIA